MNIRMLGTGSILTKHMSACALINERILIDCPNGIVKSIRNVGINPKNIEVCIITHFHADHYFDIPFLLLEQALGEERKNDLVIIGPPKLYEHIEKLFMLAYPEDWDFVKNRSKLKIFEVQDGESLNINNYNICAFKVEHSSCEAYGYTIANDNKVIGFSGDSIYCPSIERIIRNSDMALVDVSFIKANKSHMGIDNYNKIVSEYGASKQILPTHMSDEVRGILLEQGAIVPTEGDMLYL